MHTVLNVFGLLLAGGLATSFAEYHFQYNLIDYIVEGVKRLFGKAKADVQHVAADVKADVKTDVQAVEKKL